MHLQLLVGEDKVADQMYSAVQDITSKFAGLHPMHYGSVSMLGSWGDLASSECSKEGMRGVMHDFSLIAGEKLHAGVGFLSLWTEPRRSPTSLRTQHLTARCNFTSCTLGAHSLTR